MHVAPRVNILGIGIHAIDPAQAVAAILSAIEERMKGYVCVTGVHGIMEAQRDFGLAQILNQAFLTTPDGMPTVWIGRWRGFSNMNRVYGPDLMAEVCRCSVDRGYTHFFYGGAPKVAEELRERFLQHFPGIQIVGTYTPPFRPLHPQEETELEEIISTCSPDLFWVGLSTPKQERFMAQYYERLDTKLMLGVGAAFDMHTGRIKDAPHWIKRAGMQWFHRLTQEPRRLWKRYLIHHPIFLLKISIQLLGLRQYRLPDR